jgi:hypothetical protein
MGGNNAFSESLEMGLLKIREELVRYFPEKRRRHVIFGAVPRVLRFPGVGAHCALKVAVAGYFDGSPEGPAFQLETAGRKFSPGRLFILFF